MTRILGIDPGLASCGWAIVDTGSRKPRCEAEGAWVTDPSPDTAGRVAGIGSLFGNLMRSSGIELVALEAWTFQGPQRSYAQTATTIPRVIERLRTIADLQRVPVVEVTQQFAKSILGVRTKADVKRAVAILVDGALAKNAHAADAIAAALAGERKWRSTTGIAGSDGVEKMTATTARAVRADENAVPRVGARDTAGPTKTLRVSRGRDAG